MLTRLVAIVLSLALAGCATPRSMDRGKVEKIKSVAIAAVSDDTLSVETARGTQKVLPAWSINALVLEQLRETLKDRYEVRLLPYDTSPLVDARSSNDRTLGRPTDFTRALKKMVRPGLADAIVIWDKDAGIGFGNDRWGLEVNAWYTVDVFDGHTLEPIGEHYGRHPDWRSILGDSVPYRQVKLPWSGERYEAMSPLLRQDINAAVCEVIVKSIPYTLAKLNLVDMPKNLNNEIIPGEVIRCSHLASQPPARGG
jgi:hypothetical protein